MALGAIIINDRGNVFGKGDLRICRNGQNCDKDGGYKCSHLYVDLWGNLLFRLSALLPLTPTQ